MSEKYNQLTSKSSQHDCAFGHVTGESIFIDDIRPQADEVKVVIVTTKIASGKIKSLKTDLAERCPGVVGVFTAQDFHSNNWGPMQKDQPLLVEKEVNYFDEPLAVVAATTELDAREAAKLIEVEYSESSPVLTITEARERNLFMGETPKMECGDVDTAFKNAPHKLKGQFNNGGQEHFYLESQACIAYPGENGEMFIQSSSQHPTEVQHVVSGALGLRYNQVVCTVKRMGGGFGGKESQASHIAALAALVAQKTGRSARLVLTKDEDMAITGKRHPFQTDYEVAFDDDGKLLGLKAELFADGGAYLDLSPAILQRAMFHIDNAYFHENARIIGRICKTNTAANTAFRGFGGPQGAAVIENIMEDIAKYLKKDAYDVRRINVYGDKGKDITHYGQVIEGNVLPQLFDELHEKIEYKERRKSIAKHNSENHSTLKGMALTATKFGISFTAKFLNQGSALVNIHTDGTVQVSTGATEMGQGVNTKIQNIVSEALGIDNESVKLMPTSTEKNHNTSATAASSGSDINGHAALLACNHLKQRLASLALQKFENKPRGERGEFSGDVHVIMDEFTFANGQITRGKDSISFKELILLAYLNRIQLGEYGFYKTPEIHYDPSTGKGRPFLYYTNGVVCSEVSIDRFTGESKILRADILMDLGRSINQGIDYGQVAGAYIQSAGWCTDEELKYSDKGQLLSHSPTTYKIPNVQDTPRIFNIDFIENKTHASSVKGSKAVGEPPFLLGLSVFNAIKDALSYETDSTGLKLPATGEEILRKLYEWEESNG